MSRIEDIRARLDRYWSDDTAAFVAHAPSDVEDLLAVVEAARLVSIALAKFGSYYVVDGRSVRHELDDALARLDASDEP